MSWRVLAPPPAATWGRSGWTGWWRAHCGVGARRASRGCAGVGVRPGHPQWPPWGRRQVRGVNHAVLQAGPSGMAQGPPAGGRLPGQPVLGRAPRGGPPRLSAPRACRRQVEPRWSSGTVQPVHHAGQRPGSPQEAPDTLVCDNYTKMPGLGADTMWGAPESAMWDPSRRAAPARWLQGQEAGALREAQGMCPRGSAGPARGPSLVLGESRDTLGAPSSDRVANDRCEQGPRPAVPTPAQDRSPGGRGGPAAGTRAHTCPPPRGLRAENFTFPSEAAEAGGEDASGGTAWGDAPRVLGGATKRGALRVRGRGTCIPRPRGTRVPEHWGGPGAGDPAGAAFACQGGRAWTGGLG